jgi:trehalose 6-phosphate phosphatase
VTDTPTTPVPAAEDALSDEVREQLARVAGVKTLLVALDFDGTLSPHVVDPMTARMLPEAQAAIEALVHLPHTLVALVSGRSLVDLRVIAEHTDDSLVLLAGSHGAEYWIPGVGAIEPVEDDSERALRDQLQRRAEQLTAQ